MELPPPLGDNRSRMVNWCHATINLDHLDPACELPGLVANSQIKLPEVCTILNLSFGMLGINSAVIVREVYSLKHRCFPRPGKTWLSEPWPPGSIGRKLPLRGGDGDDRGCLRTVLAVSFEMARREDTAAGRAEEISIYELSILPAVC